MKLTVEEARHLSERTLIAGGYTEDEANRITQHIMDTELRGLDYGGLARTLSIFERTTELGYTRGQIEIVHELPYRLWSTDETQSVISLRVSHRTFASRRPAHKAWRLLALATHGTPVCCLSLPKWPPSATSSR